MALEKVGVRATIEGLSAFESGMRRMDRSVDKYGDAALTASKRTKILTDALKKVGLGLTAAAAASGALLFSSVKLAARVETLGIVTKVLGKNIGKTEQEIRKLEQAIVDEGITLRTARQAIALMIQSNVDLSKATQLATLAQNAAVIAGINSSEAFERLTFVITSGNIRMARTLGLQVSFAQGMKNMAAAIGTTADKLTPLQRIQARTNEVLRAGTNIAGAYTAAMESVGKAVTSLPRFIEESKRALGEAWLPVYAKVVGFVTDSLKAWLALDQSQRDVISTTLGLVTAITGLLGVLALLGSVLPGLITGLASVGTALGVAGTFVFSTAAVMGILVTAIVAVGAAFVALFATIEKAKRGVQLINDAYEEHKEVMLRTANNYELYRAEVIRSGLEVAKTRMEQRRFNAIMEAGGKEAVLAAAGIELFTESQFEGAREIQRAADALDRQKTGLAGMATEAEKAAAAAEKLRKEEELLREEQELLRKDLDLLGQTMDMDLTPKFEDYQEKIKNTESEMHELTKEMQENEAQGLDTGPQREALGQLQNELEETRKAWDKTTKNLIFNLAEQRLAIDGFTKEEIKALRRLAGPDGLGLVDAASVALLEKIDLLADTMDAEGDQVDIFAEDMVALQEMMLDPTISAIELAMAIASIQSKTITVTTTFATRGGAGAPPSVAAAQQVAAKIGVTRTGAAAISPKMLSRLFQRQAGGFLQAGQAAVVGEGGPEIFAPRQSGMVLNNRFVGAINSLVAAIRSVPALMSAPMTPSVSSATTTNNFEMNINSSAPTEQVAMDFQMMQAIASRRR